MFSYFLKIINLFYQIILNVSDGALKHIRRGHEHICWINIQSVVFGFYVVVQWVKNFNLLNFIAEKVDSKSIICIARENIYRISFYAETAVVEFRFGTRIKTLHQTVQQFGAGD